MNIVRHCIQLSAFITVTAFMDLCAYDYNFITQSSFTSGGSTRVLESNYCYPSLFDVPTSLASSFGFSMCGFTKLALFIYIKKKKKAYFFHKRKWGEGM